MAVSKRTARTRRIPDRGDIVWLDFNPQAGHEQTERRRALINLSCGVQWGCTTGGRVSHHQSKGYPFQVSLPPKGRATGFVLADQVKSIDWQARNADVFDRVPAKVVDRARQLISTLL